MNAFHPDAAPRALRRAFVAVLVLFIAAACGGDGDGGTEVQGPVVTSVSPDTVVLYEPDFILTVNGSGFVPESLVQWDGS
ncbi:MAG TPA: hypothetical protein VLK84_10505, partial [Longimicrobium sp.]|nr:hypothetical protein [Longimicrobium sp.]